MPFNTVLVASTATLSADLWQQLACLPERLSTDQLLHLFIGLPVRHLGRWALYLWTYLCIFPPYSNHPPTGGSTTTTTLFYEDSDSDSDSDSDEGSGGGGPSSSAYHRNSLGEYLSSYSDSHSD